MSNAASVCLPEETVEELLAWADGQIALLEARRDLLDGLREAVVAQDLAALEDLLAARDAALEQEARDAERRRAALARRLAPLLGVRPGEVTLGRLAAVAGPGALAIGDRRERLRLLTEQVRRRAETVARLVRFTQEVNRQLLAILAGADVEGTTYSPRGAVAPSHRGATFEHSA